MNCEYQCFSFFKKLQLYSLLCQPVVLKTWSGKTWRNHAKLVKLHICCVEQPVRELSLIAFCRRFKCRRVPEVKDITKTMGGGWLHTLPGS